MGELPEWYGTYRAAALLHCPPWELEERPDGEWWASRALVAEATEQKAAKQRQRTPQGK